MDILIPLITGLVILTTCAVYTMVTHHQDRMQYLRDCAERRARLQAWEAEIEFLKAERPNSLDKIIK